MGSSRSRNVCRALQAAPAAIGFLVAAPAAATGSGHEVFEWSAPPGCPSRAAVLESLDSLAPVGPESWRRFASVRGQVTRLGAGFRLELGFSGAWGTATRSFTTRACSDLADAAAVALAIAMDPAWSGLSLPQMPAGPAASPSPALEEIASVERSAAENATAPGREPLRPGPTLELNLGAEGLLDPASLGETALGLGAFIGARQSSLGAELFGAWLPARSLDVRPNMAIELSLISAGSRGCYWLAGHFAVCAEVEVGSLSVKGHGLEPTRAASDLWLAPAVAVQLSSNLLGNVAVQSRVSLATPVVRPDYFVNGTERVHEIPQIALRIALGVGMRVP